MNCIQKDFLNWIFDEEKNTKYWALENGERIHPNYDANAIIEWLNNVRFKKGIGKAKLNCYTTILSEKEFILLD